jgi:hypothetical protein
VKASIRKLDGQWVATRPGYGFGRSEVTRHGSWKAAKEALFGSAVGSAAASFERGHYTLGTTSHGWSARRGTIRMEDTA